MMLDLKSHDMGMIFVKKWVLYGYDICLFHMIPELDTLKKA